MSGLLIDSERTIAVRAIANKWIMDNFPDRRRHISHSSPVPVSEYSPDCHVNILAWSGKDSVPVGVLRVNCKSANLAEGTVGDIDRRIENLAIVEWPKYPAEESHSGFYHDFIFGDGIAGAASLEDRSVDLLLTDPPYGISNPYTCESQVPRRMRNNGRDFIMPKGHFGDWDNTFPAPDEWTTEVLPKVRGWAVIFCAHSQIGEYDAILRRHKFVAVGAMVWQKTNPVPFNHTFKPINAWESIVVGKRSGTKFNGRVVHNVFKCKSPSPHHRVHPTQKPLPLITEFVKLFSSMNDTVLDPFGGGGTTLIASTKERRKVISYENDPDVFRAAYERIASENLP